MGMVGRFVASETRDAFGIGLRVMIVALTLATAYIHTTLGSMMFMANAAGYTVLAIAMVVPIAIVARYRWLVRAALAVFTAVTILGWVMFGARFWLGYLAKGIEIVLIVALLIEMYRYDGGPVGVTRKGIDLAKSIARYPRSRRSKG